jgi:hypothetical protein
VTSLGICNKCSYLAVAYVDSVEVCKKWIMEAVETQTLEMLGGVWERM